MGLVERIQAARKPKVERNWPVGQGAVMPYEKLWGHDNSQFSPNEYGSYIASSNEIYAAANLRARLMAGLRIRLYRGTQPERTEVTRGPAVDLLRYVNPFWTQARLARMDELSMCLWGETYWAIERNAEGVPSEIWWLKPSRMRPVPDEEGYLSGYLYQPIVGQQWIPFKPDEIVWFRYPNPIDEFSALSPVAAARLAADTASAMMTSNRNLFRDGLQMGGLIVPATDKVTFSPEQAGELERMLEKRWKGVDKAHRWAVLRYEAQMKEMGVSPKDAEFLGGLDMSLRQVCNAMGVPSPLLNDLEHATLANVKELLKSVWTLALVPDSKLRAEEIAEQFLPMFPGRRIDVAEYDYSAVPELQEAASEVWARERQAIDSGRKTINEVRRAAGEPSVPWGDVWWCPSNKFAVTDATSVPQSTQLGAVPADQPTDPAADPTADGSTPDPTTPDQSTADSAGAATTTTDATARDLLLSAFPDFRPPVNGHKRSN